MESRLGILLDGQQIDLDKWRRCLRQPFDPYVDEGSHGHVLWSASLANLDDQDAAYSGYRALVRQVNGAMLLSQDCERVSVDGLLRRTEAGQETVIRYAVMSIKETRSDAFAASVVLNASGIKAPQEPEPSSVQTWLEKAQDDESLEEFLMHASEGEDWFGIYKALDALEEKHGGQSKLTRLSWVNAKQYKLLKRTANAYRHSKRQAYPPPEKPMPVGEAFSLLRKYSKSAFDAAPTTNLETGLLAHLLSRPKNDRSG